MIICSIYSPEYVVLGVAVEVYRVQHPLVDLCLFQLCIPPSPLPSAANNAGLAGYASRYLD